MAARIPPGRLPSLAYDGRAVLGKRELPQDRFPGHHLFRAAEAEKAACQHGRGRSGIKAHLRQTRRAIARAKADDRSGGRRDLRQRVGDHDLQGETGRDRDHFLFLFS